MVRPQIPAHGHLGMPDPFPELHPESGHVSAPDSSESIPEAPVKRPDFPQKIKPAIMAQIA